MQLRYLFAFGLAFLPLLAAISAAQPVFELYDAYWLYQPVAGSDNTLVVRVRYLGLGSALTVNAKLTIHGVAGVDLQAESSYTGYVASGAVLDLEFDFSIPEGAKASYYPATLVLEADGASSSMDLQVGFYGEPGFEVSASPTSLKRGEVNDVIVSLTVKEAPARGVEVRVTPASPFVTVIGGSLSRSGLIGVGEQLDLRLKAIVDSSAGDSVGITVTVTCYDYARRPLSQTVTLGFRVVKGRGYPHFAGAAVPSKIPSGRQSTVTVRVTNIGSANAFEARVTLSSLSPGVAIVSGSTASLGDMPPGASRSFAAAMRVDRTVTGTVSLQLVISYMDETGSRGVQTLELGLEVGRGGAPLLAVYPLNESLPVGPQSNLTLKVANIGDAAAADPTLDLVSSAEVYVLKASKLKLSRIEPGKALNATFTVRLLTPRDAVTLTLRLKYYDDAGYEYNDIIQVSINVSQRSPLVTITPLNRTLTPNRVGRVVLQVENTGSSVARNVSIALTSQSPELGAVIGPSSKHLGEVGVGERRLVEFEIFVQPRVYGAAQFVAVIEYGGDDGQTRRNLLTLGFEIKGEWEISVASVVTIPPAIFPGDKMVRLVVTLVNSGDYMARDVRLHLLGSEWVKPSSAAGSEALIPYLPVGQSITLTFLADVNEGAEPGNHELVINASGRHLRFTLTVLEKARFAVRNVSSVEVERGGKGYRLIYEVENLAEAGAEDVRVELFSPLLTGSTSTYLGTLSPREKKVVVFEVNVDRNAPAGPLAAELKISWTQETRGLSQYLRTTIFVKEPKGISLTLAVLVAAAVLAGALLFRWRERVKSYIHRVAGKDEQADKPSA